METYLILSAMLDAEPQQLLSRWTGVRLLLHGLLEAGPALRGSALVEVELAGYGIPVDLYSRVSLSVLSVERCGELLQEREGKGGSDIQLAHLQP